MDGPSHFLRAEELLDAAAHVEWGSIAEKSMLAEAHVHATLALAAATVDPWDGQWKQVIT
jgi:hypothetical protein